MHLFGSDFNRSLVVSSSGDKMTSSPAEMRTTPKRAKSQTKADDDADKERLPQRHRSREHQQVPTAATPTRATNLRSRLRAWVDDAETERLPLHHRIPTCLGGRRRQRAATSTPSHPCVPGWTTLTPSSYLHSIASAHGSASQIQKIVQENTSQIKNTSLPDKENFPQHQALSFVKDFRRGGR